MIDVEKLRELAEKLHASCDNGLDPEAAYEAGDIILAMAEREKRKDEEIARLRAMIGSISGIADAGSHHTDCPDCTRIANITFGKVEP